MRTLSNYPQMNYIGNSSTDPALIFPSATFSQQSHQKWSSNHFSALAELHKHHPPTHWLTIKFNQQETTDQIRLFLKTLSKSIENHNRRSQEQVQTFGVAELGSDETVHFHVLVRSPEKNPQKFFQQAADKFNKKHGTIISVPYCAVPDDHGNITAYSLKLNHESVRLFLPGSLTRCVGGTVRSMHQSKWFCRQGRPAKKLTNAEIMLYRLCEITGDAHPDYLMQRVTCKQLLGWELYAEQVGHRRDILDGMLMSLIANQHRSKDDDPFKAEDFMPYYKGPELDQDEILAQRMAAIEERRKRKEKKTP
ncbi:MAG: hypothetical protein U0941_17820 [Planctomycetaceae bacterium]